MHFKLLSKQPCKNAQLFQLSKLKSIQDLFRAFALKKYASQLLSDDNFSIKVLIDYKCEKSSNFFFTNWQIICSKNDTVLFRWVFANSWKTYLAICWSGQGNQFDKEKNRLIKSCTFMPIFKATSCSDIHEVE